MKNNIEGGKSRNPAKEVAKKLVGPITAFTLFAGIGGLTTGCEGKTVNITIPTPSAATGTPQPRPTESIKDQVEKGIKQGIADIKTAEKETADKQAAEKARTDRLTTAENKAAEAERAKTAAENKATAAENKVTAAENKTTDAERARTAAENKTTDAEKARAEAERAKTAAERARTEAENKATTAENKATAAEKARTEAIANIQAALYAQFPFVILPVPSQTNIYRFPEIRNQPNWISNPTTSEPNVPSYWNTTIDRTIGPGQIGIISGGPMTIDYSDQNGYGQTLAYSGGTDRVTLAFFLGNPGQYYGRTISARGLVPSQNWVGRYNTPDGNPANQYNWLSLMNAKVAETFGYGGIPGGTRYVDVVIIDGNNRLINQYAFARGY